MKAIIGAAVISVSFYFMGRKVTEQDRTAVKQLSEVLKLLRHIKDRISLSLTPLPDIYESFECNESCMTDFISQLKKHGLVYALDGLVLPHDALPPLREMAYALGRSDRENQCEKLENTIGILERVYEEFKQTEQQKSKSIQALFSLAGAVAVILMF